MLTQFYRTPVLSEANQRELVRQVRAALDLEIGEIETEARKCLFRIHHNVKLNLIFNVIIDVFI